MPETLDTLISQLSADNLMFADVLAFIERHYHYQPQPFDNGPLHNVAGENQGSCKILGVCLTGSLACDDVWIFSTLYRHLNGRHKKTADKSTVFLGLFGRDGVIRTLDPLHPMQVRYRAALRPDKFRLPETLRIIGEPHAKGKGPG